MSTARKKSIVELNLAERAAAAAGEAEDINRHRRAVEGMQGYVTLPGGSREKVENLVDHEYIPGEHSSIFAATEKIVKDPKPGHMYVWADKKDANTFGKIRAKKYFPLTADDILGDTDAPIETYTMAGADGKKNEYIGIHDLILCEVPPQAVKELYKRREQEAILRLVRNQPFADAQAEARSISKGGVHMEIETKDVRAENG